MFICIVDYKLYLTYIFILIQRMNDSAVILPLVFGMFLTGHMILILFSSLLQLWLSEYLLLEMILTDNISDLSFLKIN